MNPDLLLGLFSMVLSCGYSYSAWTMPDSPIGNPMAPKYFPLALGAVCFALGIALVIRAIRRKSPEKPIIFSGIGLNVAIIFVAIVYLLIFEHAGFIISTLLFLMALLTLVHGVSKWKLNSIITLCFTLGVWYVFERIFYINLP